MEHTGQLKILLKKIVRSMFPELSGYQYPIRCRVVKLHETGGVVTDFDKRYAVDVQPLDKNGADDLCKPVIPDVAIPVIWAGNNRGLYCLPQIGAIVRVGFYYWDAAMPYVDAVLADGYKTPTHVANSFLLQQADGVKIEIKNNGDINISSGDSKLILTKAGAVNISAKTIDVNGGTINVDNGGNISIAGGGAPIARIGDSVQCSCGYGTITSGSTKATCGG